jgi:hypothetical protein
MDVFSDALSSNDQKEIIEPETKFGYKKTAFIEPVKTIDLPMEKPTIKPTQSMWSQILALLFDK